MARLVGHFRGLTLEDVRRMRMRDYRALVDAMNEDLKAQERATKRAERHSGAPGVRRVPVMR
ncbi:hypothetical protein GCM10012275_19240 [Longimycelium tulufanense]|uniref:Uncharacterized protein n=1 Tax=Longimycelium tulufanense TaxID=907463 RepID=A0A8J3C7B4_9PSEU|nr:hypothetical protein [Longimycelium tulufanense]GGM48423.1 hypothetical protein GCM10012275_19240 [Longimycelium tulufanense]